MASLVSSVSEPTGRYAQLLQLFQNFADAAVQLARNGALLGWLQPRERLAQVPVDYRFHRDIITPPGEVVSADEARLFRADVLLKRRDKVDVLLGRERHEHPDRAVQAGVQQHLPTTGDHGDLVDARNKIADVEVGQQLRLVRCAHKQALFVQDACARRVLVHLVGHLGVQPVDKDVPKAVARGDGRVIDHRRARDPAWLGVVCENEQPVFRGLVDGVVDRLLHIADDNAGALRVEGHDGRTERLVKVSKGFNAKRVFI
jgi:hypothetical protein